MDDIQLAAANPLWPILFAQESARLRAALGPIQVTRIEHFGSTAVPGLAAKPVIDILIGVSSLEEARRVAVPALERLGYAYWDNNPDQDRLFFVKGLPPNGPRTHHVHIADSEAYISERVLFRDILRAYPAVASEYLALKRDLAARFPNDREAYTAAKGKYITAVLSRHELR